MFVVHSCYIISAESVSRLRMAFYLLWGILYFFAIKFANYSLSYDILSIVLCNIILA